MFSLHIHTRSCTYNGLTVAEVSLLGQTKSSRKGGGGLKGPPWDSWGTNRLGGIGLRQYYP